MSFPAWCFCCVTVLTTLLARRCRVIGCLLSNRLIVCETDGDVSLTDSQKYVRLTEAVWR